ncbi:MAG: flagellar biosynthetic protein FliO [Parvibaculum sp.]|uniref:flagellar biosynthetic protein FliO n=1 Tax=Parvibaculum sp. TaxID=2024848 RepID=UPI002726E48B|nr:flagellar biosynthetic protein FliO [Parvibaculum sp.]MDO8839712.1 flagellar biosynthetic protein FliO [Parvibaculum sp.]
MDVSEVLRFAAALVFIIGLIGLCAFVARRLGFAAGGIATTGSQRRLAIVEVKPVDAKHRLLLIRRDGKEHLILLGGEHSLLIEGGIDAPAPVMLADTGSGPAGAPAPVLQFQRIVDFIKERRA